MTDQLEKPVDDKVVDTPDVPEVNEDEKVALEKGWKPKDKWEGPEDEWRSAKVFNEIGVLKDRLTEKEKEAKKLNKTVQLMKDHHLNVRDAAIKQAIDTLRRERQAALKSEDFAAAETIRDKIDEIKDNGAKGLALPKEIEAQISEIQSSPDPAFTEFLDKNPWYKPNSGETMTKKADALGYAYTQQNPDWDFSKVIKAVEVDIKKLYPEKFETPRSPLSENGSRKSEGGGTKDKANLDAEQKAVAKAFGMTDDEYAAQLKTYKGR